MWARYDAAVVREELATLARHWARHDALLLLLARLRPPAGPHRRGRRRPVRGLPRRPCPSSGSARSRRSSSATCPARTGTPVARGRDLYRDVWLVAQQAWFAEEVAPRYARHPAVVGWLVSNEMPLYGGPGGVGRDHRVGAARRPGAAGRRCDPARLARRRRLGDRDDGRRQRLLAARARAARGLPRAALVPDGGRRGAPGARAGVRLRARRRVREARRPRGVRRDLRLRGRRPRRRHLPAGPAHDAPRRGDRVARLERTRTTTTSAARTRTGTTSFEMHFGVTDRHGGRSPASTSCGGSRTSSAGSRRTAGSRSEGDVALVVPEHFEHALPVHDGGVSRRHPARPAPVVRRGARGGPARRDRAGAGRARVRGEPLPPAGAKLLTAPASTGCASSPTAGATVYLSYFAGSTANQRGPWVTWLDELFGVEHRLRYGLVDPIDGDSVTFELRRATRRPVGRHAADSFAVAGEPGARSYLPVEPAGAEVVAVDGEGRPALLRHRVGAGQTILCTYPLEHMAARTPASIPRRRRGSTPPSPIERGGRATGGRLRSARRRGHDPPRRRRTAILVNCTSEPVVAEPVLSTEDGCAARPRPRRAPAARRRPSSLASTTRRPTFSRHGVSRRE